MKFKQRALSLLLMIAMVLTFMPALAFADDNPADDNSAPVVEGVLEEAVPAAETHAVKALAADRDSGTPLATFDANGGYFKAYENKLVISLEPQGDGYVYMYWDWAPVRDGAYKFDGWSLTKDGPAISSADENFEYEITEDMTFYARWAPAWVVTFDANGGYFYGDKDATTCEIKVSKNNGDDYLSSGVVYWEVEDQIKKDGNNVFSHW